MAGLAAPEPLDLSHHFSATAKNRVQSKIKGLYKFFALPGIGNLAGGLPNHNNFPFDTLGARTARPDRFPAGPSAEGNPPCASSSNFSQHYKSDTLTIPGVSRYQDPPDKVDLESALQYGLAQGYPPLYNWLRTLARDFLHPNVPYKNGPEIIMTCGSVDGFSKVLELFNNVWLPERDIDNTREGLLVEKFTFSTSSQAAKQRGMNIVPVELDEQGMCAEGPGGLLDVLKNWDSTLGKRPHLLYTITVGQNPTSGVLSFQRRQQIYAICSKFDVIIVEDDPYFYLQFSDIPFSGPEGFKRSGIPFFDSLIPSFLSIDTDGRVIRLDTFSKTVAPGCRAGWITTQPMIVERILRITESSTQQPSGFVQSILAGLVMSVDVEERSKASDLHKPWGFVGWSRWLEGLRDNYKSRMTKMCNILEAGDSIVKTGRRASFSKLETELCFDKSAETDTDEWSVVETSRIYRFSRPAGGMFLWLQVDFWSHPMSAKFTVTALSKAFWVFLTKQPYRILVSPGSLFASSVEVLSEAWSYFRLCFAALDYEDVEIMSRRFVSGSRAFWKIRNPAQIQSLIGELEDGQQQSQSLSLNFC